jgi:NADH-quinone oxidoreductase subunit J
MTIAFYILSAIAVIGALLATRLRNLVHATLCLMMFFAALAGIFVMLLAEFIAAVQLLIYVGSVGILILFAIMLTTHVTGEDKERLEARGWIWGLVAAAAVLIIILIPALQLTALPQSPIVPDAEFTPSVANLGKHLMNPYAISLEVMALLLTSALIGAVVVATHEPKDGDKKENFK